MYIRRNKGANIARFASESPLLAMAVVLLAAVVTGQLLPDLSQPAYYVDQPAAIGDELNSQDSMTYWALPGEQLHRHSPVEDILLGYQSPTLGEAILSEQLLEKLNNELKRRAQKDSEQAARQELVDILGNIKDGARVSAAAEQEEEEELKISPPVNNPLEFEASARIMEHLSLAANNDSSASDLVSLDTLLSTYLNGLVKEIDDDGSNHPTAVSIKNNDDNNLVSETRAASSKSSAQETEQQREDTTPASRYGSAEYIDHPLAIIGHQYVQGGAGEGKQLLGPDGTFENVQVIKTDHAVPSYCDPPNPCPIGFRAEDGCLENFVNSASSSREYQAKQQCSCDNEHSLFNCASPISTLKSGDPLSTESAQTTTSSQPSETDNNNVDDDRADKGSTMVSESRLETLARTIQNRFGGLPSIQNMISGQQEDSNNSLD